VQGARLNMQGVRCKVEGARCKKVKDVRVQGKGCKGAR
jgi:hypothetical protein